MAALAHRQIRQVLVAVDLSPASERLIRRAALLPLAAGAKLELLHVLPERLPKKAAATAERDCEARLRRLQLVAERAREGTPVTLMTMRGLPYVEIVRRSRAIGADLVVVGRQGRKRLRERLILGSTPKRVIRSGEVPVLVVTLEPPRPYRRPVVAVDLSDTSRRVVDLARRLLGPEGSHRVLLVHAYHVPFEGWLREDNLTGEFKKTAVSQLVKLRRGFGDEARRWRSVARKGDPRTIVLAEAARRRADLIVLGTHGGSGVSHVLLGSVAEWVVSEATCDVAITRPLRYAFELP